MPNRNTDYNIRFAKAGDSCFYDSEVLKLCRSDEYK